MAGCPFGDLPLAVHIASLADGADTRFGVGLDIPAGQQFVIFDSEDARLSLEVVDDWLGDPAISPPTVGGRGLELFVLRTSTAPSRASRRGSCSAASACASTSRGRRS